MGGTATGYAASAIAGPVIALVVGSIGFDSGAAVFVAGDVEPVVAAVEFVLVSDVVGFVTASVALESGPGPFVTDVTVSVAAGGASRTVAAVSIAGGVVLDVGAGSVLNAGNSGADSVSFLAAVACVESEAAEVVSEVTGLDCVVATADSASPLPG
jgi:hypothetical protein